MIRYEQLTMYATKKLNGSYKYKEYINIFPSKIDKKPFPRAESFTVEIAFKKSDPYFRFGTPFTSTVLGKKVLEITHLLSLFLMYQIPHAELSGTDIGDFTSSGLPAPIGEPEFYQNTILNDRTVDELFIPKDISSMFQAYLGLNEEKYNMFRSAMFHFYNGVILEQENKTLSFVSFILAIETLMNTTFNQSINYCKACGQKEFKVSKKFKTFIKTLSHVKQDKYINSLYKMRSSVVHNGHVFLSDRVWDNKREELFGSKKDDYFIRKNMIKITRLCLLNWLVNNHINDNNFVLSIENDSNET